ncbi:MAG TPA: FAD-dependent oxidoreductase, partial [Candidatus Saccharimonadales bacterium]|nr:FAD-dependent oxidoreductase [Candidatus Saccharimonadales bacterium]
LMANQKTKVLILGGGFAGIKAGLELEKRPNFDVTLLSDKPNFRYYPALYHAATGGSTYASNIPLAEIFKGKNVKIVNDTAKKIDREAKKISGKSGDYDYDVLIIALGVITNYFGIKGLKEYSYGIKTQEEAQELRDHIHKVLADEGKPDINYIVVGGGPTGVELAGALPFYIRHVMQKHKLPAKRVHIDLVEAAPRLMPRMPRSYSKAVARRLRRLGIKLYLGEAVQAETHEALLVSGHPIESHTVIWTAGITNHPFFNANKFELTDHGKVKVSEYLEAEPNIYVIGDNADTPYSGMAQTALHDAKFIAEHLERKATTTRLRAYKPKRPIYVTPAGPRWAAVLWNKVQIYGWLGWTLRSAADLRGYHDYEPWWLAGQHWTAEYETQDNCPVCTTA